MFKKIKQHKKLTIVILILILLAGVVGFFVYKGKATPTPETQMPGGIQAFKLAKQDMSSSISTSGTVESASVVEVTTEVVSPIKELNVALGDHVEKGQVLCTFDDQEIRQQIAELESQNAAAQQADELSRQRAQRALEQAQAQAQSKAAAAEEAKKVYESVNKMVGDKDKEVQEKAEALVQAQQALQAAQSEYEAAQQAQQEAQFALETLGTTAFSLAQLWALKQLLPQQVQ